MFATCIRSIVWAFAFFWIMDRDVERVSLAEEALCPTYTLSDSIHPKLSESEKRLVCGDASLEAWKSIPPPQSRFHLRNFLQERGYLHPQFGFDAKTGHTRVELGHATFLKELEIRGAPSGLNIRKRRGLMGQKLTPDLLKAIEDWIAGRLQSMGYPCPEIESEADADTGKVTVRLTPGPLLLVKAIQEEVIPGLAPGTLRRYDAFLLEKPFDRDLLALTENRVVSDNLVQSTHFSHVCREDGVYLQQDSVPGLPRVLSAGVGINTEGILLGKASWRSSRLGRTGSWMDFTLRGSAKEQRLIASSHWYALSLPGRFYFRPEIEAKHQNEKHYEVLSGKAQFTPTTTYDDQSAGFTFSAGPALEWLRTLEGRGPDNAYFLTLQLKGNLQTHDFEYYRTSPRSGISVGISTEFADESLWSEVSAQRLRAELSALWNVGELDPPFIVLGIRSAVATVVTGEAPGANTKLPPLFLEYLGGSGDIRGFGRKELPLNGFGGLSSYFLGWEGRLANTLPWGLEPFVFVDMGRLGGLPFAWDDPLYWSPGLGLRWASPIGVVRTTVAHGFPDSVPGHWQIYLSLGEEF